MSGKKVGVILSGCGVFDGTEIQEAVATMLALEQAGIEAVYLAPNKNQAHVIDHSKGAPAEGETRNVMAESARITRGKIEPLSLEAVKDLDGIIFPGGFGAAKNLSDYAFKGSEMQVDPVVAEVILSIHNQGKPIAALCVSPVILGKLLGDKSPKLTLGAEGPDAENLKSMGGKHHPTNHEEVVVDEELKLVTGPCYMLDAKIQHIFNGAKAVVERWAEML